MDMNSLSTLQVSQQASVCRIQFHRPAQHNAINRTMIEECHRVLDQRHADTTIIVLEGNNDAFCVGMDFHDISQQWAEQTYQANDAEPLFDLWARLVDEPVICISHVQGRVNAGGMGFVAASDLVIAHPSAQFSLSELVFGLLPACVLPFLMRKIGHQKANYMTLATWPFGAEQVSQWGLVDVVDEHSERQLRKHLARLSRLKPHAIAAFKGFSRQLATPSLHEIKPLAIDTNQRLFSNPDNLKDIQRYVESGLFPWEADADQDLPGQRKREC